MYIYKAAVIGGGTMGAGIAQVISFSGIPVILKEINNDLAQNALMKIKEIYAGRVAKGKMSDSEMQQKMALVSVTSNFDDLKEVDIVIEAVPEEMPMKKKVFAEIDKVCAEHTIFATNTSALSITELAASTKRPQKVIGMHFFFPANVMKLVEVIPALQTDEETINDVMAFTESLRKIPVKVQECAGFLVNRLLLPYLNEAVFCLQENAAPAETIDKAAVEFGMPMGPLFLSDNLGLDVCIHAAKVLEQSYGPRMKTAELLEKMLAEKLFGKKTGKGFYNYSADGASGMTAEVQKFIAELGQKPKAPFSMMRLLAPMVNEAAWCLQENIASAKDIELAMMAGTGFPQQTQGLLHWADNVGVDVVLKNLEDLYAQYGLRFFPAPILRRMVAAGYVGVKSKKGFFDY